MRLVFAEIDIGDADLLKPQLITPGLDVCGELIEVDLSHRQIPIYSLQRISAAFSRVLSSLQKQKRMILVAGGSA